MCLADMSVSLAPKNFCSLRERAEWRDELHRRGDAAWTAPPGVLVSWSEMDSLQFVQT